MEPVFINFTDSQGEVTKTFSACSLKTGTMDNFFEIAEKAQGLDTEDISLVETRKFFKDLKALIVEIFGDQFTFDELNKGVDLTDLIKTFRSIGGKITSEFSKN